jgi:hypothetical protein
MGDTRTQSSWLPAGMNASGRRCRALGELGHHDRDADDDEHVTVEPRAIPIVVAQRAQYQGTLRT